MKLKPSEYKKLIDGKKALIKRGDKVLEVTIKDITEKTTQEATQNIDKMIAKLSEKRAKLHTRVDAQIDRALKNLEEQKSELLSLE